MVRTIVTALAVAGVLFGPANLAYAGKGGNGGGTGAKGGGKQESPSATLQSSCDSSPCLSGEVVYFSGEGYDSAQGQALLQIGAGIWSGVPVDADGTVDFTWNYFQLPGEYSVQLYQNGKGQKLELKAEVTVSIVDY